MAVNLAFIGGAGWQFFDDNGVPLSGGKIYTYAAGTTTPLVTYTARDGLTPNTNPIILDSAGRTPEQIWSVEGLLYKYVVKTSTNTLIRTWDNIGGTVVADDLAQNLANTSNNAKGDALVGFKQSNSGGFIAGATGRTVNDKLQEFVSVKDFGAVGDGLTDDTAAIVAAVAAGAPLYFPAGTYLYKPTVTLDISYPLTGAGKNVSIINCLSDAAMFGKPVFRLNSGSISNLRISEVANTKTMHGISISAADESVFTGYISVDSIYITGFNRGLNINNVFSTTVSYARINDCTEGIYAAPIDTVGDNGYFTTLSFISCWIWNNVRNVYFSPALKSPSVMFQNCAIEKSTGSAEQSYFSQIEPLIFVNCYWEGARTIPALRLSSCSTHIQSGFFNDCGAINLGTTANTLVVDSTKVSSGSPNAVIFANGASIQKVVVRDSAFPATGNTLNVSTLELTRTAINGYDSKSGLFGTQLLVQGTGYTGTPIENIVRVIATPANNTVPANASLLLTQVFVSAIFADAAGFATPNKRIPGLFYSVEPPTTGSPDYYDIYAHNNTGSPVSFTDLTVRAVIMGF